MKSTIFRLDYLRHFVAGCILSIAVVAASSQEYKVRMAFIGNSITYGATLDNPAAECYPSQLADLLSAVYGDTVEIFNAGVSGRTMLKKAQSPIWNEPVFRNALKFVPDICLIMLGTNDAKPFLWDSLEHEFLIDYRDMIDTFRFRNPNTRFIVCHPPPIWEGHPYGTTFENSHNDSIVVNHVSAYVDSIVLETGATLVDFHTPFVDSLQYFPDKLHPNAEGSAIMAGILYDTLMATDLIGQVEAGLAYVSDFSQARTPIAVGSPVELEWTTLFADSVFLDGMEVDPNGSMEVIAEAGKVYTLTAKGPENTSEFALVLDTYVPEINGLKISSENNDYRDGDTVVLYSVYTDQYRREMLENTSNITWTIKEGDGAFGEQTDTSIVFIPVVVGRVVVEATDGEFSDDLSMYVNTIPVSITGTGTVTIQTYPNPVYDQVRFKLGNLPAERVSIRIYALSGKKMMEEDFRVTGMGSSELGIQTSWLGSGIYLYSISSGREELRGRFLKMEE